MYYVYNILCVIPTKRVLYMQEQFLLENDAMLKNTSLSAPVNLPVYWQCVNNLIDDTNEVPAIIGMPINFLLVYWKQNV